MRTSNAERRNTPNDEQLLLSRKDAAALLGVTVSYVQSLERAGMLKGLRLSRSATAMVFFKRSDIVALVEQAAR
jgi:hypothetical protein